LEKPGGNGQAEAGLINHFGPLKGTSHFVGSQLYLRLLRAAGLCGPEALGLPRVCVPFPLSRLMALIDLGPSFQIFQPASVGEVWTQPTSC